jgi:glucose-1-phosphate adenylyltransferase
MAKKVVAMILAGGKGTRLQALTKKIAKPAVYFGGKYRIIDFSLSNVANTGISSCGVLTQYESVTLNNYIGDGEKWGFNGVQSIAVALPPRQTEEGLSWYEGTADAIYQNIDFLDSQDPEYVLILSGDHIYKTTYNEMLEVHEKTGAACTISVIEVDWKEASRFGILEVDEHDKITKFVEKPKEPKSNLASMGVYVFTYKDLRKALIADHKDPNSEHDFGKNIIPSFLEQQKPLYAYRFHGYWRDVGTLDSLHLANMELLPSKRNNETIDFDAAPTIFSEDTHSLPQFVSSTGSIKDSLVNQGAIIEGDVYQCVISNEVVIEKGAIVKNSVIMPDVIIHKGAYVNNAIISPGSEVKENEIINKDSDKIVLIDTERSLQ